jgi:hypothetical protein
MTLPVTAWSARLARAHLRSRPILLACIEIQCRRRLVSRQPAHIDTDRSDFPFGVSAGRSRPTASPPPTQRVKLYFADPKSAWQRGTNEKTNDLLCQYFSEGHRVTSPTAGADVVDRSTPSWWSAISSQRCKQASEIPTLLAA